MKRGTIYLLLSSIALFIVIALSEKGKKFKPIIPTPTSAQMLTEPEYSDSDQREYKIVIDPTGKERRLYLKNVDASKEYDAFYLSNPTAVYSQVEKNNYYFMRSDGKGNYTVYRDKGEVVGKFRVERGYVNLFIRYNSQFYLEWRNEPKKGKQESRLAKLNLDEGNIKFLANMDLFKNNEYIYENKLYVCEGIYLKIYDLQRECYEEIIETTNNFQKVTYPEFLDGKFYYGFTQGNKVKIFTFDPETKRGEEILYFEHNRSWGDTGVSVEIDDENIYCADYVIPRGGGKIYKESAKGDDNWFYNNYSFYLDDDYKVHRVSEKTGKDIIITKMDAMDVQWTQKDVYIQAYEEEIMDYDDDDQGSIYQTRDDDTSCDLYCMDLNGKNKEKIAD